MANKLELAMANIAEMAEKVLPKNWHCLVIVWREGEPKKNAMMSAAPLNEMEAVLVERASQGLPEPDERSTH